MKPKALCYLAHPVAGAVPVNLARAKRWLKALQDANPTIVIIAPWIGMIESQGLEGDNDNDPELRAIGLSRDCYVVGRCDAIVLVGGRISNGMQIEMNYATTMGSTVMDLTHLGDEPPSQAQIKASVQLGAWF